MTDLCKTKATAIKKTLFLLALNGEWNSMISKKNCGSKSSEWPVQLVICSRISCGSCYIMASVAHHVTCEYKNMSPLLFICSNMPLSNHTKYHFMCAWKLFVIYSWVVFCFFFLFVFLPQTWELCNFKVNRNTATVRSLLIASCV